MKPFSFDGRDAKKVAMKRVREQEEEGARIIHGRRHVGSGAIEGIKSDASSKEWQQEAKQTEKLSMWLKLAWLEKITREARLNTKRPMLFIRFTKVPEHMVVEPDWIAVPASIFKRMIDAGR